MTSDAESGMNKKKFWAVVRRPAFFILINFFFVNTLFAFLPWGLGNIAYNLGRICIIFYGGWLVVGKRLGGLWHAASVGMFLYFIDHVFLKGGVFLLNYMFTPSDDGLMAFQGVIVSFILLTPVAMALGALGGLVARNKIDRPSPDG